LRKLAFFKKIGVFCENRRFSQIILKNGVLQKWRFSRKLLKKWRFAKIGVFAKLGIFAKICVFA
jgi:hypothetical protein